MIVFPIHLRYLNQSTFKQILNCQRDKSTSLQKFGKFLLRCGVKHTIPNN